MNEKDYAEMSTSEKKKEDWMNSKWRPMMGWLYMAVCAFDFVIFPVLWSLLQAITHSMPLTQWQPLTLQGAGLFHIAMGAVLGIAALGRTQEKLAGANNGGLQLSSNGASTFASTTTAGQSSTSSFGFSTPAASSPTTSSFGSSNSFAAAATPNTPTAVVTGFGGKPAPIQPPDPVI